MNGKSFIRNNNWAEQVVLEEMGVSKPTGERFDAAKAFHKVFGRYPSLADTALFTGEYLNWLYEQTQKENN